MAPSAGHCAPPAGPNTMSARLSADGIDHLLPRYRSANAHRAQGCQSVVVALVIVGASVIRCPWLSGQRPVSTSV